MIFIGILIVNAQPPQALPMQIYQPPPAPLDCGEGMVRMDCPECGWYNCYTSEGRGRMGLASHKRHCRLGHGTKVLWGK